MNTVPRSCFDFKPAAQSFERFTGGQLPAFAVGADIDHSIVPWKENKYRKEVNAEGLRGNQLAFRQVQNTALFVVLTGIDLKSVQEISSELNGFPPIDILATDNGLEMHVNNKGEPSGIWLAKGRNIDSNNDWEAFLQTEAKWDRASFSQTMFRVLNNFGLREVTENTNCPEIAYSHHTIFKTVDLPVNAVFCSGESAIYLLKEESLPIELVQEFGDVLARNIVKKYNEINPGSKVKYKLSEHDKYFYIFFSPNNEIKIDKASAFEASLKFLPQNIRDSLKYAVVIGDSENDTHVRLGEVTVPWSSSRIIPVYAIISGKYSHLLDDKEVMNHPRLVVAEEMGNIGNAFQYAVQRADKEVNL